MLSTVRASVETSGRPGRTRDRVVDVATRHLAEHGLDALRGPAVAADAGVSEATVWHHVGTKAGLLTAVMEAYYDGLLDELDRVVDAADSPTARLDAFARFWLERTATDLPLTSEFARHGRGRDPEVVAAFATCNRRVTRRFERLLEDLVATGEVRADVPVRLVRDVFFGAAEHVTIGNRVAGRSPTSEALARTADDLLSVLRHGTAPGAAEASPPSLASIDAKLDRLLRAAPTRSTGRGAGDR